MKTLSRYISRERKNLRGIDTAEEILLYDKKRTVYVHAERVAGGWAQEGRLPAHHCTGTSWKVRSGSVVTRRLKNASGSVTIIFTHGEPQQAPVINNIIIPDHMQTKREILSLVKRIGTLTA